MKTRFAETAVVDRVRALPHKDFTSATLGMGRDGWRRLNPLVCLGVLTITGVTKPGGRTYRYTGKVLAALILGLACSVIAQVPPLPALPADPDTNSAAPVLYPTTIAWNASAGATAYRVICASNHITLSATNVTIQTPEGRHGLTLTALRHWRNGELPLESVPVQTNLVVTPMTRISCDVEGSPDLATWTATNLPPAEVFPARQGSSVPLYFYRLQAKRTDWVERTLR